MPAFIRAFALVCAIPVMAFIAGCASAPVDFMRFGQPEMAPAQERLRQESADFVSLIDDSGWAQASVNGGGAVSFLSRLISGGDGDEDSQSLEAAYLEALDGAPAGEAMIADINRLAAGAERIAELAVDIASAPAHLSHQSLARDVMATENALSAARRSAAFFRAVRAKAELADASGVNASLNALEAAISALALSADALAERRWAARTQETS